MRKYNPREKEFLKLLNKISNQDLEKFTYFLSSQYFTENQNSALFMLHEQKEVLLFMKKKVFDNIQLRKIELRNFIEILSLMGYLKQNRLIDLFYVPEDPTTTLNVWYAGFGNTSQSSSNTDLVLDNIGTHLKYPDISKIYNSNNEIEFEAVKLEKHTYQMINDNFLGLLFVSEELKEFVNNDFKSKEDLRYRMAQITTWIGLGLALIFGLFGIYNPFEKEYIIEYEFNENQFKEIIKNNSEIHDDIHKIMKSVKPKTESDSLRK